MIVYRKIAGIAQVVERGPEKAGVGGATPSPGTFLLEGYLNERG